MYFSIDNFVIRYIQIEDGQKLVLNYVNIFYIR